MPRIAAALAAAALVAAGLLALWVDDADDDADVEPDLSVLREETGALVAVSSDTTLTMIDVDARTVERRRLEELAAGDPLLRLVRRGDSLVFYGHGPAGGRAVHVVGPARDDGPRVLAEASLFLPSADEDHLWLARPAGDGLEVAEVGLGGAVRVPWRPLPYEALVAAIRSGLVLQDEEGRLLVWDPRGGAAVMRLAGAFPLAAEGDVLAWCDEECRRVHVTHIGAGLEQLVELPEGARALGYAGAFAPGGRLLAVPLLRGADADGPGAVLLVELRTGARRLVADGLRPAPSKLGWTPSGERLFFHVPGQGLLSYCWPDEEAERVLAQLPGPVYGFAVVQGAGGRDRPEGG